jgi:transcriptional regulator with XRE-family HTH domain
MNKDFPGNLKKLMTISKISAKDLSKYLALQGEEVSYRTIEGWRDSRGAIPSVYTAASVAEILEVSLEELVTGIPEKVVPPRLRSLVDDLFILNEVQIDPIFRLAHSYAAEIRAENANKPSEPDPGTKANRTAARGSIHPVPSKIRKEGDA